MKHKTWFRLVLRAIGVLVFVTTFPSLITSIISIGFSLIDSAAAGGFTSLMYWQIPQGVGHFIGSCVGLYLFFGGEWIVNKAIPSNRPYCSECGYDLSRSRGTCCPECGVTLPPVPTAPPIVRHPSQAHSAD